MGDSMIATSIRCWNCPLPGASLSGTWIRSARRRARRFNWATTASVVLPARGRAVVANCAARQQPELGLQSSVAAEADLLRGHGRRRGVATSITSDTQEYLLRYYRQHALVNLR